MKEYGEANSWTKQYTFRNEGEAMIPLGIFENGELIMEREKDGKLFSYASKTKTKKSLRLSQPARIMKYVESLVSPRGRTEIAGFVSAPSSSQTSETGVEGKNKVAK